MYFTQINVKVLTNWVIVFHCVQLLYLFHSHFACSFHPIKDIWSKGMYLRWLRLGWGRKGSARWWRWEKPPRPFPHTSWGIWAWWLVLLFPGSLLKTIYVSSNTEKQIESHGHCWNWQLPKRLQCWLLATEAANSPVTGLPPVYLSTCTGASSSKIRTLSFIKESSDTAVSPIATEA